MFIYLILLATTLWIIYMMDKRRGYPPGPFPLPLIGNLHLLRKDIHLAMDRLSKEYGGMFTLWMANIPYIVITDIDVAKKVCMTRTYADRLPLYVGDVLYSRGSKDIIMGDYGKPLVLHRKLAHSALRMFGDGMISLEARILKSFDNFLESCNNNLGDKNYNISGDVEHAFFNVMSSIVFGEFMDKQDQRFVSIRKAVFFMMQSGVTFSLMNFYPILRHLPNKELNETIKVIEERDETLRTAFDKAEKEYKTGKEPNSYIEALLMAKQQSEKEDGKGSVSNILTRDHLEMNVFDMFLGGVETVSMTAMWSILYLIKWPEIQELIHEQLDKVIGRSKSTEEVNTRIRLENKKDLPLVMAAIYETLRLSSPLPFGVFHKSREDSQLNGYNLKKGNLKINIFQGYYFPCI